MNQAQMETQVSLRRSLLQCVVIPESGRKMAKVDSGSIPDIAGLPV
jgi:hypothetical protein